MVENPEIIIMGIESTMKIVEKIKETLDSSMMAEIHQICINLGHSNPDLEDYDLCCLLGLAILHNEFELESTFNPDDIDLENRFAVFKNKITSVLSTEQYEIINDFRIYFPIRFVDSISSNYRRTSDDFDYFGPDLIKGEPSRIKVEFFNILPAHEPRCGLCDRIITREEFRLMQDIPPYFNGDYQFYHVECDWNERFEAYELHSNKGMNFYYARGIGIKIFPAFRVKILFKNDESFEAYFPVFSRLKGNENQGLFKILIPYNLRKLINEIIL